MRKILLLSAICIMAYACSPTSALTLKTGGFEKGDKMLYSYDQISDMKVSVMGQSDNVKQQNATDYLYEVTDVASNGNVTFDITIKDIIAKQQSAQQNTDFNSKTQKDVVLGTETKVYQLMLGQKLGMTMTEAGKVVEFSGADEMYEKIFDDEDLAPMADMMKKPLKNQFGNKAMIESMSGLTGFYPDKPIKVGKTWTSSTPISALGVTSNNTYTLKKRENGIAFISVVSSLMPTPDADPLDMGIMEIKYDLKGTQTGLIKVDEKTGWAIDATIKQKISGEMTMMGAMVGGEMSADIEIEGTNTFKKVK